jgi:hypothetical protein
MDGQADMTQAKGALRDHANAPKNRILQSRMSERSGHHVTLDYVLCVVAESINVRWNNIV